MRLFDLLSHIKIYSAHPWRQYLLDTALAATSVLLLTYIISAFHLYPRIPNVSIIYLLIVLPLASTRGRYASILASLIAFFSFDFFIIPPLFTFVIYRVEEWIALFVFLATAIFTGQLAATLRRIAEEATRHEQETAILYKLVRITNNEDQLDEQLHALTLTIVDIFSPWGVSDCAILQADTAHSAHVLASTFQSPEMVLLSRAEQAATTWVMEQKRSLELVNDVSPLASSSPHFFHRLPLHAPKSRTIHLYPLQVGQKVIGVLRLCIQSTGQQFPFKNLVGDEKQSNAKTSFFHIFLDQVASLVERAHLRHDHLRIELLQRTDALRAALLTSVSHDLRTPLTAIKAAASSLLQEEVEWDNEARLSFALSIEGEADRLNRLVGNLLDMSRIEGGVLKPEKEWYPLTVLIRDVLNRLQPLLQQRDLHIDVPNDFTVVELDYVQIDQVLTNVLENALRYSPTHSPLDVSIHFEASEVIICIADRGPGIPEDDLERIFDKFYRVMGRQSLPEYPPGSGLGLAICKGVVEAHGGHIWAEQRPGGGSLFSIALPVGKPEGITV
jgi:two-component system, OmpR family, sensor histidine kinase KdpD